MIPSSKTRSTLLILLLIISGTIVQAQSDLMVNAWMEFGSLKFTPVKKDKSAGVDVALKCQINKLLGTIQYVDAYDKELKNGGLGLLASSNHYHTLNFMMGVTNKKCRFGHASISSGIGYFWGEFNEFTTEKFQTICLPIEAATSINLFLFLGINLKVFANMNSKHSLYGFGFDLQLGKMRNPRFSDIPF